MEDSMNAATFRKNHQGCLEEKIEKRAGVIKWHKNSLSRWTFEKFLDDIATEIYDYCNKYLGQHKSDNDTFGCSILYLGEMDHYYVGGTTADRTTMRPTSRFYKFTNVNPNSFRSFTLPTALRNISFVLDDFQKDQRRFEGISHSSKSCELKHKGSNSFLCIPCFKTKGKDLPAVVRTNDDWLNHKNNIVNEPPSCMLRMSFSQLGVASVVHDLFTADFLIELFKVIERGQEIVLNEQRNNALAIANLEVDLLRYRNREFDALLQLVRHLQILIGNCECSVFIAHKEASDNGKKVELHLAATTAQSDDKQHKIFRKNLFRDFNPFEYNFNKNDEPILYECYFNKNNEPVDKDGEPVDLDSDAFCKTEKAYYDPMNPFIRAGSQKHTKSQKFAGKGEFPKCASFLAMAIPSPHNIRYPYGVIRIVRPVEDTFEEEDKRLAAAIARAMTYWVDFFPKKEDLKIEWTEDSNKSDALKKEVLHTLFEISPTEEDFELRLVNPEKEFKWLLQKVFFNCSEIKVKRLYTGKSGAIVLLVENDSGLDLILKCCKKKKDDFKGSNEIIREIENYAEHVQGKLELNHNIIYKELVRETLNLIGFATSFLGSRSRDRISITDYCRSAKSKNLERGIDNTLVRIVEKLINEVWGWWYHHPHRLTKKNEYLTCKDFVRNILNRDNYFAFLKNEKTIDTDTKLPKQKFNALGIRPADLWRLFVDWTETCQNGKRPIVSQQTVTHGDCHGDNLFFDPKTMEIWVIDFAYTGWKEDIFDLAMLESDIKFRHIPNIMDDEESLDGVDFIPQYREFEECLASQQKYEKLIIPTSEKYEELKIASKVVTDIRKMATQNLGRRGYFDDYQIVLLFLAFKTMRVLEGKEINRRILPYLSALEILKQLVGTNCRNCLEQHSNEAQWKCNFPTSQKDVFNKWFTNPDHIHS